MMRFLDEDKPVKFHQPKYPEFQAIILAGYGNRLGLLTEEDNLPKALLPIANRPMIWYVIEWLERSGISDILVVSQGAAGSHISHSVKSWYDGPAQIEFSILNDCSGSADAIRQVKDRIKHDFVVVGCDLISALEPYKIFDFHRLRDASITACLYEPNWEAGAPPKDNELALMSAVDCKGQRLLIARPDDTSQEDISVRMSMLTKYPKLDLYTDLQDTHIYVCKHWVLDLICTRQRIQSIREDLLPLLAKCQYKRGFADRQGVTQCIAGSSNLAQDQALDYSTMMNPSEDRTEPRVCAYIDRVSGTGRANTIQMYSELNRQAIKSLVSSRIHKTAETHIRAQVGTDSAVGESTRLDERCSVKKSCIGAHCVIGKNVRISNCVIMDNVVIEDNVKLEGCIVCQNVRVQEKASLKDCIVGAHYVVVKDTNIKGEELGRATSE